MLKINPTMALTQATLETRSAEADKIIETLTKNIEAIKAMGTLPSNIQETILKQENSQLRYLKGSKIHHVQICHPIQKVKIRIQKTSRSTQSRIDYA